MRTPTRFPLLLPLLLLLGVETGSRAAQVSFNFTNNVTGLPDTNTFRVIPIDNYVESGGGFIVKGPPVRLTPKADGRITNSFEQGDYVVTNTAVSQGFIIRVPLDHGATIYNATSGSDNGGLALSGFNRFVTITYGTNLPPTFDEVTNALGGPILLADAVTNTANSMASRITNGFTAIVYTNPAVVLTTNFLPTLTNGFITSIITNTLATTNYVHGQGFVTSSVTNGLATTNYVNAVANTNGINVAAGNSFVTLVTNAGLVTISGVNQTNGFTSLATTNASQVVYTNQLIVLTNGYVKSNITNGLAPTNYVHGQGFVTATVTNGLATITYVDAVANTNGVNVSPGNTFVTMVTNAGLVTISGVNQTNGFLKTRWTTNNDTAAIDGSKLVNIVATNVSAPITNRWRQDITNAIDANVLNPDLLTLYTNATSVYVNTTMIVATNSSQALRFTNANNLIGGTLTNSSNVGTPFSSRGTLLGSEQFGLNSSATAIQSTAIGYNSVAASTYATAIGATAEAGNAGFTGDVAIGPATDADGGYATAIGFAASATATNSLGIGNNSYADGNNALAIGAYSRASNANSIVIGFNSRSLADNQIVFGGASSTAYFPGNAQFDGSLTNGSVTLTNLNMGSRALFQQNTNVIEVTGAGSSIANGMYFRSAGWWTNSTGAYLTNISGVHYIYSNAVTLYSSAGLENATWTQVSGALPVPSSYKGTFVPGSALFVTGIFQPTNLVSLINSNIGNTIANANGSGTNTLLLNPTLLGVTITNLNAFSFNTNLVENSYSLRAFGAVLDGEIGTNVSVTSNSTTITIASGNFNAADVGKPILIYSAGTTYSFTNDNGVAGTYTNCLLTGIAAVTTTNTATLSNAAQSTISGTSAIWGTDDSTAWNAALDYVTKNGGGTILVPNGISIIANQVKDPIASDTDTNIHRNAQLLFPEVPVNGQVNVTVKIRGATSSGPQQSASPYGQQNSFGTLIVPMLVSTQRVSLFNCEAVTNQWFISNPPSPELGKFGRRWTYYNRLRVELEDMAFRFPVNPYYLGIDLRGCDSASIRNIFVDVGAALGYAPYPQYSNSCAVLMPEGLSAGICTIDNLTVYGFRNGLSIGEHLTVGNYIALECWNAVALQVGGHICNFSLLDAEVCKAAICSAPTPGSGGYQFSIEALVTGENPSSNHWSYPSMLVDDPGNSLYGRVTYENTDGTVLTNRGATYVDTVYLPPLALPRHVSNVRFDRDIIGPGGTTVIGLSDNSNIKLNPPAAGGSVFINWDRGTGVNFGNGAASAIVAKVDTTGNTYFNGDITNAGTATIGKTMVVSNSVAIGDNLSFTNGNAVLGLSDKTNVKLNPPVSNGGVYINWDRGTGVNFGNGAGAFVAKFDTGSYQQATNAIANWPTAALTGGGFAIVNSNATVYILTSTVNSTAWAATNKLAGP